MNGADRPARVVPLLYFGTAYVSLALACVLAAIWPRAVAGFFYHSWMVAIVHLITLGWITFSLLGTLYIVGPVAPLTSRRMARGDYVAYGLAVTGLVGMVAHGSYVYEDLTARENLCFWETMRGGDTAPARLEAALAQVELDGVADERVRTFSAGMKRRLGLARVLLGRARLLLLDEPFTGLDRRGQKWVNEFLLDFKAGGGTAVVATHSFGSGLGVADPARFMKMPMNHALMPFPSSGRSGAAVSATRTSPLGST